MAMQEILRAAFFTPTASGWGLPLAFEAGPGTAKSDIIEAIAAMCNMACLVLSPGERGEGAFGVVAVPIDGYLTYPAPDWVKIFEKDKRGVCFLDELTTAAPAIQPPILGLALKKRIGASQLPPGVRMVAAYNAPEDAAAGYDLPKPTANRFGHIKWDAGDVDDWIDWLTTDDEFSSKPKSDFSPEAEERRVLTLWPEAYAKAKGVVSAFMKKRPELLHKEPLANSPQASRAWPSRRTWTLFTRAYATAGIHDLSEVDRDILLEAFVGNAAAGEFLTFINTEDLPDPVAVLDGNEEFKHDVRRLDRTYAVLNACVALVVSPKADKRKARVAKLWDILLGVVDKGGKDIAYGPARRLAQARLLGAPSCKPVLRKLNAVMEAAGIQGG